MEQQKRWAKFVSLLIRIDKFLRIELSKWWLTNSEKFINNADSTVATIDGNADDNDKCDVDNDDDDDVSINDDKSLQSETSKEVELVFYEENVLLQKNEQQTKKPKSSSTITSPSIQELLAQITNVKAMHAKIQVSYCQHILVTVLFFLHIFQSLKYLLCRLFWLSDILGQSDTSQIINKRYLPIFGFFFYGVEHIVLVKNVT